MSHLPIGRALVYCLALVACLATRAEARPGSLQLSFGEKGVARVHAERGGDVVWAGVANDGDGRVVVLTRSREDRSVLLRLRGNGALDPSFGGGDGWVPIGDGPWNAVAVQPDGRIVIAGSSAQNLALMRFTADGAPDPSFDGDGLTTLHVESPSTFSPDRTLREALTQVVVRPDGRIVALGALRLCAQESCTAIAAALAGYRADGGLDPSFGTAGTVLLPARAPDGPPPGRFQSLDAIALREDGRVLVGGDLEGKLAVLGFGADGSPDPSWGADGVVTSGIETSEGEEGIGGSIGEARAVLLQPGGRIVVAGDHSLLGLLPDGRVDRTFGRRGAVFTESVAWDGIARVRDGTIDSKGRILLAGEWNGRTAILRMFRNGRLDPRFAGDGLAALDLSKSSPEGEAAEGATGIAIGPNDSVLGAGFAYRGSHGELVLAKLSDGDGRLAHCRGRAVVLQGTPGPDRLSGGGPIAALGGDDTVIGRGGPVCAGGGNDSVEAGGVSIYGGRGDDRLTGGPIFAREGLVAGGPGNDVIRSAGERANDLFRGGPGADVLFGGGGQDRLFGGPGADRLIGGDGSDWIWGGAGDDLLLGGPGFNRLRGGPGRNTIRTGPTGPPFHVYMAKSRPALRVRLTVRRHQVAGVHIRAVAGCNDGRHEISIWSTSEAGIEIAPDGRFREHSESEGLSGYSGDILAGRLLPGRIVGTYRTWDSEEGFCATGKPHHRDLRFVARRIR